MESHTLLNNVLHIEYPLSVQIDEQWLHNTMIRFGDIMKITNFPSRHYSLVEFRTVQQAKLAVESLQASLFNDSRITVTYSKPGLAPGKDHPDFISGNKGPRFDMLPNEPPFQPPQMGLFGQHRPVAPNNFPGQLPPGSIVVQNAPRQSFGTQGPEPPIQFGQNWIRPSPPAPGMLSSPVPDIRPPMQYNSGAWDGYDINKFQTDSMCSRVGGGVFDPNGHLGPLGTGTISGVPSVKLNTDHIWRGIISKSGTSMFSARCVPIRRGIFSELPPVIDCTGKRGLEVLKTIYADAIGSDVVYFLPDSEGDFLSFTEFLRYLQSKERAAVAMCSHNTALFLVPPTDFVTSFLNVTVPNRLIGVILYNQAPPSKASVQQATQLPTSSTQLPVHPAVYYAAPSAGTTLTPAIHSSLTHSLPQLSGPHQIAAPPTHPHQQFGSVYNIHSTQSQYFPSNAGQPAQAISGVSHSRDTTASLQPLDMVSNGLSLQQRGAVSDGTATDAGTYETDAEKNKRCQGLLQFATSLLHQIQ